jgi:hypothetical protein
VVSFVLIYSIAVIRVPLAEKVTQNAWSVNKGGISDEQQCRTMLSQKKVDTIVDAPRVHNLIDRVVFLRTFSGK